MLLRARGTRTRSRRAIRSDLLGPLGVNRSQLSNTALGVLPAVSTRTGRGPQRCHGVAPASRGTCWDARKQPTWRASGGHKPVRLDRREASRPWMKMAVTHRMNHSPRSFPIRYSVRGTGLTPSMQRHHWFAHIRVAVSTHVKPVSGTGSGSDVSASDLGIASLMVDATTRAALACMPGITWAYYSESHAYRPSCTRIRSFEPLRACHESPCTARAFVFHWSAIAGVRPLSGPFAALESEHPTLRRR